MYVRDTFYLNVCQKDSPVLAAWRAMEVDDHLQAGILRPLDSLLKVWELTLNIRLAFGDIESPITNVDTDVIQAIG
jgi:hypothetical protein